MSNEKLEPCPFCGEMPEYSPAAQSVANPQYGWEPMITHNCKVYGKQMCFRGDGNVISRWNTRSPQPQPVQERGEPTTEQVIETLNKGVIKLMTPTDDERMREVAEKCMIALQIRPSYQGETGHTHKRDLYGDEQIKIIQSLLTDLAAANEKVADMRWHFNAICAITGKGDHDITKTVDDIIKERDQLQTTLAELMGVVEEQAELFCDIEESLSGYVDGAPDATNFSKTANYVNDNIAKQITAFNHFKQKHPEIK